ncbi:hypothetical protein K438DRAFT_1615808, partial [Mycena galopus ATCC 62051]
NPLQNMPFNYSNRKTFAIKCIAYMGFGFALPFVAVGWQWCVDYICLPPYSTDVYRTLIGTSLAGTRTHCNFLAPCIS